MFAVVLALALALLCFGLSWGPAIHVWAGLQTLHRIQQRRSRTEGERVILACQDPFLYGTIAADLISFKGFGGLKNHCHNWNMRDRMLPFVTTREGRAFYLGYLCHLAADVSSHNHFVPYHRVAELPPRVLGHTFWEGKADASLGELYWRAIERLRRNEAFRPLDDIVDQAVAVKAFSIRSNRLIFHTFVLGQGRAVVVKARGLLKRRRAPVLAVNEYLLTILKARVLRDMALVIRGEDWPSIVRQDPSGRIALRAARALRRQLLSQYPTREAALPSARLVARDCFWP